MKLDSQRILMTIKSKIFYEIPLTKTEMSIVRKNLNRGPLKRRVVACHCVIRLGDTRFVRTAIAELRHCASAIRNSDADAMSNLAEAFVWVPKPFKYEEVFR